MIGLFVAIEGPKSVGKTTLVNQLRLELGAAAASWLFTKEPTGHFDLDNEQSRYGIELATLIADDRRRHLAETICPALERGQMVVTDRYVLSSYVFHCLDGVGVDVVADLNAAFPAPDLLVILQCSPQTLEKRRLRQRSQSRFSSLIPVEDELLGYITYARHCRPVRGEIILGYNETMMDCTLIAQRLVTRVRSWR